MVYVLGFGNNLGLSCFNTNLRDFEAFLGFRVLGFRFRCLIVFDMRVFVLVPIVEN